MDKITNRVKELAQCLGAAAVGISTIETLAGGPPPLLNLTYVHRQLWITQSPENLGISQEGHIWS